MTKFKPVDPRGYDCVNVLVQRAIGKVRTMAKSRLKASEWQKKNRKRQNATIKRCKENNREKHLAGCKAYNDAHIKEALEYQRNRRLTDAEFAVKYRMRARLSYALKRKGGSKSAATFELVGCSADQLKEHLQNDGLSLIENVVDHIFPIASYDVSYQQAKYMNYTNTQLLARDENRDKSDKLPTKAMAAKVDPACWPDGVTMDMLPDIYPGWATPLRM